MFRNKKSDVLNSALSGGLAMNLDDELDYLIPRMKEIEDINFESDWKMITIQIGSKFLRTRNWTMIFNGFLPQAMINVLLA